jgi:hypothetical protein
VWWVCGMLSAGVHGVQYRRGHGGLYSKATATGPGLGIVVQNGSITGGTGRFAGTTGSIPLEHDFNEATNVLKGVLAGMIMLAK